MHDQGVATRDEPAVNDDSLGFDDLVPWSGRGCPPALEPMRARLRHDGRWDRIEVGRGWWPLLARLDRRLARVAPAYEASSIGEVDGLLQFYAVSTPDSVEFTDLVWEAMLEAAQTCSACGQPGLRRRDGGGRFYTLCDEHARPLDDRERAFLVELRVPPGVVSTTEILGFAATHEAVSALFEESVSRTHLAAEDTAQVLGVTSDEVYRMYLAGELVGARGRDTQVVYPRWQLGEDEALIPGLAKVAARLLDTWRAMDVRDVMLRPNDDLDGMSPVEWLVAGFPVSAITALLLSYAYEGLPVEIDADRPPRADSEVPQAPEDGRRRVNDEGEAERLWDEVRGRLHDVLGTRSELAAALGAYAVDNQDQLRLAQVRLICEEYGTSRDPSAEELFPLLHSQRGGRDDPVA